MLPKNPFSSARVPRRDVVYWADRGEIKEKVLEFIESDETPWSKILLIKGDYGSGKTHSLIYANNYCKSKHISSILLLNPGPSFVDLCRRIINYIGYDEILLSCNAVLKQDKEKIMEALEQSDLSTILKIEGITIDRMLKFAFPEIDTNLALVLAQSYNNRNIDLGRAWLLGKNMSSTELGRLNISRSIGTDDYAVKILSDILRIYLAKHISLILLLDELEDISNLSAKDAISYSKSLRRLIDENIPRLKIIVTFTGDAFENFNKGTGGFAGKQYQALYDRLAPGVTLKTLEINDITEFLSAFITRVTDNPFEVIISPQAIIQIKEYLEKGGPITPRRLISFCNELFDNALDGGSWPILDIYDFQSKDT